MTHIKPYKHGSSVMNVWIKDEFWSMICVFCLNAARALNFLHVFTYVQYELYNPILIPDTKHLTIHNS